MKHTVDAHWQKELQIAQTQHAKEREAMIQQHEDDLEIELKQAKIQWIQVCQGRGGRRGEGKRRGKGSV